jgi:3D (Asp-Asp-Asp) domain-containing protein
MSKCLNLTVAVIVASLVVGCATQSKPTLVSGQRMPKVRTTAYTHTESGGAHNAVGAHLSGCHVMSAASDWSRFPLGTRFRIADTNEEYIIDDYGTALVGTETIDLYKSSRLDMKPLGCAPRRYRYLAMGFGGTKLESARAACQTWLCPEDDHRP